MDKKQLQQRVTEQRRRVRRRLTIRGVLSLLVVLTFIRCAFMQRYENMFVCVLSLVLLAMPTLIEKQLAIDIPPMMEAIIYCFIYAAEIMGEINSFYTIIPGWDTMLHTINGFLVAAVGFCLVDLFNRSERFTFKLSPLFLAIVAFCFSMTVGVLWEFFEFTADQVMHTDMQKDYVVHEVNSVSLNPDGLNVPVHVQIESVIVNGEDWTEQLGGYLDIGLIDTMKDLQVNCIGAIAFSIIGFFYVKHRGKGKLAAALIPVVLDPEKEKSKKDEQNRGPNDECFRLIQYYPRKRSEGEYGSMMKKRMTAGALAALMAAALPISACAAQNSAPQPQLNTAEHMQYMNGYTDGTFRPDASITRAEASKLLASLLVNKVKNEDHLFNDVSVSAWYADAVRQMTGFGLVNGYTDGTFKPNAKITRAEFVAILSRFPHTDIGTDKSFADVLLSKSSPSDGY